MLRDVVSLLQRAELVARISEEIEQYLVELGTDGRLVAVKIQYPGIAETIDSDLKNLASLLSVAGVVACRRSIRPTWAATSSAR